jgi:hypothetical protein
MVVTLNDLEKYYSQFWTSITVREIFFDFEELITLLINEEMNIVGTSSNGGSKESTFYSNTSKSRSRGGTTSSQSWH